MIQKEMTKVIDEWTEAVGDLARVAKPAVRRRLTAATGDLLEAFASTSTNLAAQAAALVLLKLEATDRRADARSEQMHSMQLTIDQQAHRIDELEDRERIVGQGVLG